MIDAQPEPAERHRLPSFPLTVAAFTAVLLLSFIMAAIHAGS